LDPLDANIQKYRPDIAVCMMAPITDFCAESPRIATSAKQAAFSKKQRYTDYINRLKNISRHLDGTSKASADEFFADSEETGWSKKRDIYIWQKIMTKALNY
jgi:hypothetical protein